MTRPLRTAVPDDGGLGLVAEATDAARIVALLQRRPDLRERFPRALSDGADGDFGTWLARSPESERIWDGVAIDGVRAAFASDPSARALLVLQVRAGERRRSIPLLPQERAKLATWLRNAVEQGSLDRADAAWFWMELAEAPERAIPWAWLTEPAWQRRHPLGITRFGRARFARWLGRRGVVARPLLEVERWQEPLDAADQLRLLHRETDWSARCPRALRDRDAAGEFVAAVIEQQGDSDIAAWLGALDHGDLAASLATPGMNLFGHFSYASGLRGSAVAVVDGARRAGVPASVRNVPVSRSSDRAFPGHWLDVETHDVSVFHVQPVPLFAKARRRALVAEPPQRPYRIGYWYSEFDTIPPDWDPAATECDELWTATSFVGDALRRRYDLPVREFLPGMTAPDVAPLPRSRFALDESAFTFLFAFHMTSMMQRKNPLGLIEAFRLAFGDRTDVVLVIKTAFGERHPDDLAALHGAAGGTVKVIDEVLTDEESSGLMLACDAYVSLHRCEGLGLTMAEAMLLGRPTIATRFSGNLDFMDDGNSLLVNCDVVPTEGTVPAYGTGLRWAEPSLADAARQMRRVADDPDFARSLGERGRRDMTRRLDPTRAGERMAHRLAEIAARRDNTAPHAVGARPTEQTERRH